MSVPEYRKYAELRVDALNYALKDLPTERVRLHTCWGSGHGPHKNDIELRDIVDIILKVDASASQSRPLTRDTNRTTRLGE
jgi:5-methyltetrahydropteroyltriglutamate--homocysteine methyltransferase